MGGSQSSSSIKQESNQMVISQTNINVLNQSINELIANAMVKEARTCTAEIFQNQNVTLVGLQAQSNIVIGVEQIQNSVVDFSCLQTSQVRNDIANQLIHEMMSNFETNNSADVLNKLDALAKTKAESQFTLNPFSNASADSDVDQTLNFTSMTSTNKNIENVMKQSVEANFTYEDVQNCLASVVANQNVEVRNAATNATITVAIQQQQALQLLLRCIQSNEISNNVTNDVLNYLDISTEDTTTLQLTSEAHATTETESLNKGIFESIGTLFASIISAFLAPLNLAMAAMGPLAGLCGSSSCCLYIISICLCVLMLVFGGAGMFMGKKPSSTIETSVSPVDLNTAPITT